MGQIGPIKRQSTYLLKLEDQPQDSSERMSIHRNLAKHQTHSPKLAGTFPKIFSIGVIQKRWGLGFDQTLGRTNITR